MKKLSGIKLVLGMMLMLMAMACDLFEKKPETIRFLNESFAVLMPASWSKMNDLNTRADLQMGNSLKEAYTIVLSENKMDFEDMSLERHSDLTRSILRKSLQNYRESEPENINIGNIRAIRYRLSGNLDNIRAVYWHVTIETKNHYHQMLLWSTPSKFPENEPDFNAVIQSFKVLKE